MCFVVGTVVLQSSRARAKVGRDQLDHCDDSRPRHDNRDTTATKRITTIRNTTNNEKRGGTQINISLSSILFVSVLVSPFLCFGLVCCVWPLVNGRQHTKAQKNSGDSTTPASNTNTRIDSNRIRLTYTFELHFSRWPATMLIRQPT